MNVFIIHHHLKTGGVTKIIQSQLHALKTIHDTNITIITGELPEDNTEFTKSAEIILIPEIQYLTKETFGNADVNSLLEKIKKSLSDHISAEDIIHIHNLNLGKNPVFTLAINHFVKNGYKIFHHCHDFSEDRPNNHLFMKEVIEDTCKENLHEIMYPSAPNYHIGTLNNFDLNRVKEHISEKNCHLLPNPVNTDVKIKDKVQSKHQIFSALNITDLTKKLVVYPVRAITRKNLGEFILLSYLFKDKAVFANTLAPKNEKEIGQYNSWVAFSQENNVPVLFNVGTIVDFDTLLSAADFCITTSYMEGFGMVYLEPWLFNTPVVGRELTNIIHDLKNFGIDFPYLYKSIIIENKIDFSTVEIDKQQAFIKKIMNNEKTQDLFLETNSHLKNIFLEVDKETINRNKQKIVETFSIEKYGEKLHEIYRKLS